MAIQTQNQQDVFRPSGNYPPTIWGSSFASLSSLDSEFELYTKEVEILKEKMKDVLEQPTKELIEKIEFIKLLCRLGVSYHFWNEIKDQLNHIFIHLSELLEDNDYNQNIIATVFQILREHGYKMFSDVFNKFKDSDGGFKKTITNDVKGLLSLYEATFFRGHGEDILDEALAFTRQHLEILAEQSSPHLANYIKKALVLPFHRNLERLEAKKYIAFYEEEESKDETLLRFAKLDYNRLQLLYRQELASLSRWWKESDVAEKLDYSRDRIVEAYMWAIGPHFEPQYSVSRILVAKYIEILTLIDDTYDGYATIDEVQHFTAAIERWNIGAIDDLPEYMKILYKFTLNFFDEMEKDGYNTCYAKETFKEMVKAYYVEAQWFNNKYMPAFDEYLRNGLVTSGYRAIPAITFLGMENIVGAKEIQWVETNPKIIRAARLISRLRNDTVAREDEKKKKDGPLSVDCYMNEHGVSKEKAIEETIKMCEDAWKDMNEDCFNPSVVPMFLLKYYVNLARFIEYLYTHDDYYTYSSGLKDDITSLFLEQLPL